MTIPKLLRRLFAASALLAALGDAAAGGEVREIVLHDGSVVSGEVVSLADGVYVIRSSSLGTLRIDATRIRAIRSRSDGPVGAPDASSLPADLQALQSALLGDPEIMRMILSLGNDPQFQAALGDPALLEAIRTGNLDALASHPAILELTRHPLVQQIHSQTAQ
jgi:hypothetical protein